MTDPLFGDADDLSHLLERQGRRLAWGSDSEPMPDDGLFHQREISFVGIHKMPDFCGGVGDEFSPSGLEVIRSFKGRVEVGDEPLTMTSTLHAVPTEGLEDRATCIGAEFEAPLAVKLVDRPHQCHVSFAHEIGEFAVHDADAFGHREYQCEVGFGNLLSEAGRDCVPLQEVAGLREIGAATSNSDLDRSHAKAGVVEFEEEDSLLGSREQDRLAASRGIRSASSGNEVVHQRAVPRDVRSFHFVEPEDRSLRIFLLEDGRVDEVNFFLKESAEEVLLPPRKLTEFLGGGPSARPGSVAGFSARAGETWSGCSGSGANSFQGRVTSDQ